ncbi:mobilization protein MobD [Nitrincola tibetensis]|uniref:Mobilization protein MobD n=1 Tax=Nitrincola tibetensis TaxID=2219697 RepID=A0A364NLM9_9GAMM|nr:mobilization protein MobD [Nitrincola tibetensis]RAU18019.1 mobilization protein MobD [Nitrincola tibetensis]
MRRVHFVGGEKGGVGKSVLSRLLSQYFLDNSTPFVGMDADQSHATLTRSYGQSTRRIVLDDFEGADQIIETVVQNDVDVLIDLPAQSERFLDLWMNENGVAELCQELGIELLVWYVVDDGLDSLSLLKAFSQRYSSQLKCVVVKNLGRGSDFSKIDAFLASDLADVQSIELPCLHAPTMRKIEHSSFSFWGAANIKEGENHLGIMERQRVKVWLKKAYAALGLVLGSDRK